MELDPKPTNAQLYLIPLYEEELGRKHLDIAKFSPAKANRYLTWLIQKKIMHDGTPHLKSTA